MSQLRLALSDALGPLYRIEREVRPVGEDRMFVVTQIGGGPAVLVKVLPAAKSLGIDEQRLEHDLLLLADRLQHGNLVPPKSCGRAGAHVFHTRAFIDGTTLHAWMAKNGALPLNRAVAVLRGLLAGLAHAHAAGVAHGNLRAEHVLLTDSTAVVVDTGVASLLGGAALRRADMVTLGDLARVMFTGPDDSLETLERARALPGWLTEWVQTAWKDAVEANNALQA